MIFCLYQTGFNCWRACLATILRVGLDDLPETIDGPVCRENGRSQLQESRRVLRRRGLDLVREKPGQATIRPVPTGLDGDLVIAGVTVDGHAHAVVALDVDGVLYALWDPDVGEPADEYPLEDVTRLVERPSNAVAAALATYEPSPL